MRTELSETPLAKGDLTPALEAARRYLLSIQRDDGHWCGELEGDTILESEYLLMLHFLGRGPGNERRFALAAEYLRRQELPGGGWTSYPGGPPDVSASVKAYFALKLAGDSADAPHMARAREVCLGLGGIEACNSFTRIYLAIFGQWDWKACPAVPPELLLLPGWFPFNVYRMSSWSRAIVVPLSIIWAAKPTCSVPPECGISELRVGGARTAEPVPPRPWPERLWRRIFFATDVALKAAERLAWKPLRKRALRMAEAWILARLEKSGGLGAIFPPIINSIFAMRCLGYPPDHPRVLSQLEELQKLEIEDEESLRMQPCFSSVWDTALALLALRESGLPEDDPRLLRAAEWLVDREVRSPGDWTVSAPGLEPGGWFFEYENEFYPDTDDTAEVLTALSTVRFPEPAAEARRQAALARGVAWQLGMQNSDGGWGAFDRDCDNELLTWIPFADHNAMIDPSCEDITGRTLDALERLGHAPGDPPVDRAIEYLSRRQEPDGTWYGRWGCNYVYGTWLALRGLKASGVDLSQERWQRAATWFRRHQNADGGWGELPRSYDDPSRKGIGPSTPSQTAWALMGLLAAGDCDSESVERGVRYLLCNQLYDGSWQDTHWTGTGFPKVFYLRYHLYATYFPLWALSMYEYARGRSRPDDTATADRRAAGPVANTPANAAGAEEASR